uniref:Uncharacterized protein n=1 Tax=Tetraselmis chuii TaxID=63592 RepID=A0A7S1SU68_9CHLO
MEGFFEMSIPSWVIRLVTRCFAILPAFYVVFTYGPETAAEIIEQAQVVVNFVVPFTVIPLTRFLSSELKMGHFRLSWQLKTACWLSAAVAILLNLLSMCKTIMELQDEVGAGVMYILMAISVSLYVGIAIYLMRRDVMVGQHAQLPPPVGPSRIRDGQSGAAFKNALAAAARVPLMYWGAGIIATGAVASLIWLDMWAPRYNEMVGM